MYKFLLQMHNFEIYALKISTQFCFEAYYLLPSPSALRCSWLLQHSIYVSDSRLQLGRLSFLNRDNRWPKTTLFNQVITISLKQQYAKLAAFCYIIFIKFILGLAVKCSWKWKQWEITFPTFHNLRCQYRTWPKVEEIAFL